MFSSLRFNLPKGPEGTARTLAVMARLAVADSSKLHPLAVQIVRNVKEKDARGEVSALHSYVKEKIRYVRDTRGVETLQTPSATLKLGAGDCDDQATLIASLLLALGYRARFRAVGRSPGVFSHVLADVQLPGGEWFALETTENVAPGWTPGGVKETMAREVNGLEGLGFLKKLRKVAGRLNKAAVGVASKALPKPFRKAAPLVAPVIAPTGSRIKAAAAAHKAVNKAITPKGIIAAERKTRRVWQPAVAVGLNVVPVVGQAGSIAVSAAIAADKLTMARKRAAQLKRRIAAQAQAPALFEEPRRAVMPAPAQAPVFDLEPVYLDTEEEEGGEFYAEEEGEAYFFDDAEKAEAQDFGLPVFNFDTAEEPEEIEFFSYGDETEGFEGWGQGLGGLGVDWGGLVDAALTNVQKAYTAKLAMQNQKAAQKAADRAAENERRAAALPAPTPKPTPGLGGAGFMLGALALGAVALAASSRRRTRAA